MTLDVSSRLEVFSRIVGGRLLFCITDVLLGTMRISSIYQRDLLAT